VHPGDRLRELVTAVLELAPAGLNHRLIQEKRSAHCQSFSSNFHVLFQVRLRHHWQVVSVRAHLLPAVFFHRVRLFLQHRLCVDRVLLMSVASLAWRCDNL